MMTVILIAVAVVALAFAVDVSRNKARQRKDAPRPVESARSVSEPAVSSPDAGGRRNVPVERWTVSVLAGIALLTFFFPLLTVRAPIIGERDVSGYDVVTGIGAFGPQTASQAPAQSARSQESPRAVPLSVRVAWLISVFIVGAFVCALLTLLGAVLNMRGLPGAGAIGAMLGIAAIVHIRAMDSDMRRMLHQVMDRQAQDLKDNPFAALGQALGNLMVSAFQMRPGIGLYVLTLSLAVLAVLIRTGLLTRLRLAAAPRRGIALVALAFLVSVSLNPAAGHAQSATNTVQVVYWPTSATASVQGGTATWNTPLYGIDYPSRIAALMFPTGCGLRQRTALRCGT